MKNLKRIITIVIPYANKAHDLPLSNQEVIKAVVQI